MDERNWKTPRDVGFSLLPNPRRITSREEGPNVKLQSATSVLRWPIFFPAEKKKQQRLPSSGLGTAQVLVPHESCLERLFDEEPGERQGDSGDYSERLKHALSLSLSAFQELERISAEIEGFLRKMFGREAGLSTTSPVSLLGFFSLNSTCRGRERYGCSTSQDEQILWHFWSEQ